MRVLHAMAMVVSVAAEEDDTVLLQAQHVSRSRSEPLSESDNCVSSYFNSCEKGTWNGRKCCYPSHYTCDESVMESSCKDIWTGFVCCTSGTPSCRNAEGAAIMDTNMEDCTNKDFQVWAEGTQDVLDAKAEDVSQMKVDGLKQDWKGSCIAHITGIAGKQSCSEWCEGHGLQCVMAMDDASTEQQNQLRAWMPAGESSQCSVGNQYWQDRLHACDKEMNSQICACEKTSCLNPEGVPIMDPNMEDCTNKNFHVWPEGTEDVLDAKADDLTQMKMNGMKQNWKGSCIAHITGTAGKQSCSEWCEGHGLQCVMAMDDASTEQQNQLRAWMPAGESSQCSVGNQYWQDRLHGCDKEMNSQICACDKTSLDVAAGLVSMNSKCHYSRDGISDERQFRLEGQATLEDCKARCLETSGCKFYSWTGTGKYAHVCMGCSGVKKSSEHEGFSLHALHQADLDSVSPVA